MSDYWKSLPRKFCDICKCWFADNKASVEFHEKGRNHQENVKKRINEIQKKGLKDFKAKKKLDDQMQKIENAALAAFKKDMEQNPELASQYNFDLPSAESKTEVKTEVKKVHSERKATKRTANNSSTSGSTTTNTKPEETWYEAVTDEGYTYYWNTVTSESRWEPPDQGYVSLPEQSNASDASEAAKTEPTNKDCAKEEFTEDNDNPSDAIGPQPKPDPYGQWVPVVKKTEELIDWGLPARPQSGVEVFIPLSKEDTFKIKEKTVGHLSEEFGSVESTFKKRKHFGSAKRNMRQRLDEDG